MSYSVETEKENKPFFFDVEITCKQGKFATTVYPEPTFSGVYKTLKGFSLRFINLVWYIL